MSIARIWAEDDMADPYFFCAEISEAGGRVQLSAEESRHVSGARRYRTGDTLWLFDGRGAVARGTLIDAAKSGATIAIEDRWRDVAIQPVVHLACALPKGDRLPTLLDMTTQIGMTSFTPLQYERSVTMTFKHDRLARICLEACKQSRQSFLPVLHDATTPADFARRALTAGSDVWITHGAVDARPIANLLADSPARRHALSVLVGPEGGFSAGEIEGLLRLGGQLVSLGPSVLRIETAAIAVLAAIRLAGSSPGPA